MAQVARGRPRSEAARRAILDAARDLVAEVGYEKLTIQAIAARSKTSRQTIYRWWTSKALIVADLVIEGHIVLPSQVIEDTGSLREDLTKWLDDITARLTDPASAALSRSLITAASDDRHEARLLYSMTTEPFHAALVERLELSKRVGQIRAEVDPRAVADALIGTVLFHTLVQGADPASSSAIVDVLISAVPPR